MPSGCPDRDPVFLLRAHPAVVEVTLPGDPTRILMLEPPIARSLARNLELYAEKAEILARDEAAAVGPREGEISAEGGTDG